MNNKNNHPQQQPKSPAFSPTNKFQPPLYRGYRWQPPPPAQPPGKVAHQNDGHSSPQAQMPNNNNNNSGGTDQKPADLFSHSSATLGSGNLRDVVRLPCGEEQNEWIAANISDFFHQVSMLYGMIVEHCTDESCPKMAAGRDNEYFWSDSKGKLMEPCPANVYIDYLLSWVQEELDDEHIFPSQIGKPFPANFLHIAQTIMKRLFRIYAHVYHSHFQLIEQLKAVEHLNTSFKHFMLFTREFDLIDRRQLAPLQELIDKLLPPPNNNNNLVMAKNNGNNQQNIEGGQQIEQL